MIPKFFEQNEIIFVYILHSAKDLLYVYCVHFFFDIIKSYSKDKMRYYWTLIVLYQGWFIFCSVFIIVFIIWNSRLNNSALKWIVPLKLIKVFTLHWNENKKKSVKLINHIKYLNVYINIYVSMIQWG